MVSFQSIVTAITQNSNASMQVAIHRIRAQQVVESFKLPTIRIAPAIIPQRQQPKQSVVVVQQRPVSPTRSVSSTASTDSLPPPPPMRLPLPRNDMVVVSTPVLSLSQPLSQPQPQPQSQRGNKPLDPICIGIEQCDAMYAIATRTVQQSIECEEARRLEGRIADLYKEESGRSRGWVKGKLEAFFVSRAAVGSRVYPKDAFDWSKIWTDKEASAILDFVCLAKGIRLAVWKEAERSVGIWPAADSSKGSVTGMHHVSSAGIMLADRNVLQDGWRLIAPYSVEHGLEKLSLDELDGLAEKMGVPIPSGKKIEKVRALASARMRLRFL